MKIPSTPTTPCAPRGRCRALCGARMPPGRHPPSLLCPEKPVAPGCCRVSPDPCRQALTWGPHLPPGTASSLVGRAPHSQLLLPPSASHSFRQLDGLSRFHSISTCPARPMPSPQGWSVLCPNILSALCHMAWYQSIVTSPFLWFHVCVSCLPARASS